MNNYQKIITQGVWDNNQAIVALLGLCPLLAVSNSTVNALALGLATLFVISASNVLISTIRNFVTPETRIPAFIAVIATLVTIIELLLNAFWHDLYLALGIFVPLIVTNCAILGRGEAFASKNSVIPSLIDGLAVGFGFLIVLLLLGISRELLATGGIFANMHYLLGPTVDWHIEFIDGFGVLLFALPPGAFLLLGLIIAGYNYIQSKRATYSAKVQHESG